MCLKGTAGIDPVRLGAGREGQGILGTRDHIPERVNTFP